MMDDLYTSKNQLRHKQVSFAAKIQNFEIHKLPVYGLVKKTGSSRIVSFDDSDVELLRSDSNLVNLKHRSLGALNFVGLNNESAIQCEAGTLYQIAQEVHLNNFTQKHVKPQYHSWPKRKSLLEVRKFNKKISYVNYHNFGLNTWTVKTGNHLDEIKSLSSDLTDTRCDERSKPDDFESSSSQEDSDSGFAQLPTPNNLTDDGISPPLFKVRKNIMKQWFSHFNDEQKNVFIQNILECSGLPQMHMLSLKMTSVLHKGCPQNCQDMLQWLPEDIVYHVLSFLDVVSLSHASQVNRTWRTYASYHPLWAKFCIQDDLRPTPLRDQEQMKRHSEQTGFVKWRDLFVERYCCKQNWINGRCKVKSFVGHTQGVSCVQFDSQRIVSGSSDNTIRVWDLHSDSVHPVLTLVGHSGTVRCLQLNGNRLVSGSADSTIKVWDLSVGSDWNMVACRVTMIGHRNTVRCLQVDNDTVISGSYDMTLKVWQLESGKCKLTLRGHTAAVLCVQFDDEKIVSGSVDYSIKVWGIYTGVCLMTLSGHHNAVTCLQFNRLSIISGSLDCTLKFWNLSSGKCIGTIDWIRSEGHTRVVRCLQADSWKIVSAGDDKTLKIWSLKTGERFVTLLKHTDGVTCLQFNDHMIVSGSYDKTVKVWEFSPF